MRRINKWMAVALASSLGMAGCASQPETQAQADLPDWVLSPQLDDGLAETACVPASNNMSLDKKRAMANARSSLAMSLEARVQSMDKTYQRAVDTEDDAVRGSTFESVSKQVTDMNIRGTRMVHSGYFTIGAADQFCVMAGFGEESMRGVFEDALSAARVKVSQDSERVLYTEFKAYQAQQELEKATSGQ